MSDDSTETLVEQLYDALRDVERYYRGKGEYNFSRLSDEERANASFDAWQDIMVGIDAALERADKEMAQ